MKVNFISWQLVSDGCHATKQTVQTIRHMLDIEGLPYQLRNAPDGGVYIITPTFVTEVDAKGVASYGDRDTVKYNHEQQREPGTVLKEFRNAIRTPDGVDYYPWTDGTAMGFRCEDQHGHVEYLYLNPSSDTDDGKPNVFLYHDETGTYEGARHHYLILEEHFPRDL